MRLAAGPTFGDDRALRIRSLENDKWALCPDSKRSREQPGVPWKTGLDVPFLSAASR